MVIVENNRAIIELPILERCKIDKCDIYQLILLHRMTRKVYVYKVRDLNFNQCPLRFKFKLEFPEVIEPGEYTYYLVKQNEWKTNEIDNNFVLNTLREPKIDGLKIDGQLIVIDGMILVTSEFKNRLEFDGEPITFGGMAIQFNEDEEQAVSGHIWDRLNVLNIGILKYKVKAVDCCDHSYNGKNCKTYKTYNG